MAGKGARPRAKAVDRTAAKAPGSTPSSAAQAARTAVQRDAYLAILQTAEMLQRQVSELLKARDLSLAQYNVLRILRGAGASGLACGAVADRLIRHDPDMTRLLDRLERRHLTERSREPHDRRIVRTRITPAGLVLLAELDEPVDALHARQFGHIPDERLVDVTNVLRDAHGRAG